MFRIAADGAQAAVLEYLATELEPTVPPRTLSDPPGAARPDPLGEKVRNLLHTLVKAGPEHDGTPEGEGGPIPYRWHVNAAGDDDSGTPWLHIMVRCLPGEPDDTA